MTNGLRCDVCFQSIKPGWSVITSKVGGDREPKPETGRAIGDEAIQETLKASSCVDRRLILPGDFTNQMRQEWLPPGTLIPGYSSPQKFGCTRD
jgi:hypothetical protein